MGLRLNDGGERYFEPLKDTDALLLIEVDAPHEAVRISTVGTKTTVTVDYKAGANHVEANVERGCRD